MMDETTPPVADLPPPSLAVIVPCYNEEGAIEETVAKIAEVLRGGNSFEILVVNDGSTDRSGEILAAMAAERIGREAGLRVINHPVNRGYGAALKTGFRAARAPLAAITDADGSYPLERLPDLAALMDGQDMVVGARTGDDVTYSRIRAIPKVFLKAWASWISGVTIPDINSGMRVFRREATMRYLPLLPDSFSFTTTVTICMLTNGHMVHYEPINYAARIGRSKIKPIRDTVNFTMLIMRTGMYFAPLRVLGPVAFVFAVATLLSTIADIRASNLTDLTVILLMMTMNIGLFALLADMIDRRTGR